jgi:hypothetical protein
MMDITYKNWIQDLKQRICTAQIKASLAVNSEMILLYWDIGKSIVQKQAENQWGSKVIEQMAKDLKNELPETNGFSRTNYRTTHIVQNTLAASCCHYRKMRQCSACHILYSTNHSKQLESKCVRKQIIDR